MHTPACPGERGTRSECPFGYGAWLTVLKVWLRHRSAGMLGDLDAPAHTTPTGLRMGS